MRFVRQSVAALVLSASALVGIAVHEGYRGEAYIPVPGDVPTIGFGNTEGVKLGDKITPERALVKVLADTNRFEHGMRACIGDVPLYQHEWDAYVSLTYNIGLGKEGVKDGFCWLKRGGNSTIVRRLKALDYEGACDGILSWDKFRGKTLPGLTKRRQQEHKLCIGK